MHKQTSQNNERVYNLTSIRPKRKQIQQYEQLASLQQSQIEMLKSVINQLKITLEIYQQNALQLAKIFNTTKFPEPPCTQDTQLLKKWLKSFQDNVVQSVKKSKQVKEIEKIIEVQKIVTVQRIVEVQKPVFIQRTIVVDRPILVQKQIQKPVYIQRVVEVQKPVFVQKKVKEPCKNCLSTYQ